VLKWSKKIEICQVEGQQQLIIDGEEFPYFITEEGPRVEVSGPGTYKVTITIFCDDVRFNAVKRDVKSDDDQVS
jgi:hypothetical protein